jgi:hypothetical protein
LSFACHDKVSLEQFAHFSGNLGAFENIVSAALEKLEAQLHSSQLKA